MRTFPSGATRNDDADKIDFDGFLSPQAIRAYAEYMHTHRTQADGEVRASDNWKKGIDLDSYMKSMWRHFFAVWEGHRSGKDVTEDLCALMFNVQGMLHEKLRAAEKAELTRELLHMAAPAIKAFNDMVERRTEKFPCDPTCPVCSGENGAHKEYCGGVE